MANLQIKGMDDNLYERLKAIAASENRSVSQQVLFLVKSYLAKGKTIGEMRTPAQVLLELSGSWDDSRSSEVNNKGNQERPQKFQETGGRFLKCIYWTQTQ